MNDKPKRTAPTPVGRPRVAVIALLLGLGELLTLATLAGLATICSPTLLAPLTVAIFVLPVAAIVLGAIALRRCRRQRRPGSGMAVTGLVMGALPLSVFLFAEVLAMTTNSVFVTIVF